MFVKLKLYHESNTLTTLAQPIIYQVKYTRITVLCILF